MASQLVYLVVQLTWKYWAREAIFCFFLCAKSHDNANIKVAGEFNLVVCQHKISSLALQPIVSLNNSSCIFNKVQSSWDNVYYAKDDLLLLRRYCNVMTKTILQHFSAVLYHYQTGTEDAFFYPISVRGRDPTLVPLLKLGVCRY